MPDMSVVPRKHLCGVVPHHGFRLWYHTTGTTKNFCGLWYHTTTFRGVVCGTTAICGTTENFQNALFDENKTKSEKKNFWRKNFFEKFLKIL